MRLSFAQKPYNSESEEKYEEAHKNPVAAFGDDYGV